MDGCVKPAIDHADQFEPVFFIAFPDRRGEYMVFVIKKACSKRQADAVLGKIGGILCGVELDRHIVCISHSLVNEKPLFEFQGRRLQSSPSNAHTGASSAAASLRRVAGVPWPFSRAPAHPQLRQPRPAGEFTLGEAAMAAPGGDGGEAVVDHQCHDFARHRAFASVDPGQYGSGFGAFVHALPLSYTG
jgi:hypothetical protein